MIINISLAQLMTMIVASAIVGAVISYSMLTGPVGSPF